MRAKHDFLIAYLVLWTLAVSLNAAVWTDASAVDSLWHNPDNWDAELVPDMINNQQAHFLNPSLGACQILSNAETPQLLMKTGEVTLDSAAMTVDSMYIGYLDTSTPDNPPVFNIVNADLTILHATAAQIGTQSSGVVNVSGDSTATMTRCYVGNGTNPPYSAVEAILNLTDNASWTLTGTENADFFYIGQLCKGTVNVSGNASMTVQNRRISIGHASDFGQEGIGTLNLTENATVTIGDWTFLGNASWMSKGYLNISDNARYYNNGSFFEVGGKGYGELNISGGEVHANRFSAGTPWHGDVAERWNANGKVDVSGNGLLDVNTLSVAGAGGTHAYMSSIVVRENGRIEIRTAIETNPTWPAGFGSIDLRDNGVIVINGDQTSVASVMATDGQPMIMAHGRTTDAVIRYVTAENKTYITAPGLSHATDPTPQDFAERVDETAITLSWTPGAGTISHDVYFSANKSEVENGFVVLPEGDANQNRIVDILDIMEIASSWLQSVPANTPADVDDNGTVNIRDFAVTAKNFGQRASNNQDSANYDPGTLTADTTYYWRVDEIGTDGVSHGETWSFSTTDYGLDFGLKPPQHLLAIPKGTNREAILLQTLQGILAKERPVIYIDRGIDTMGWLYDMNQKYGVAYTLVDNIRGSAPVLDYCLSNWFTRLDGYILYDYNDKDSITAATSLAGPFNAIAVDVSLESKAQSYALPKLFDTRGKDDQWVYNNYRHLFIDHAICVHNNERVPFRDFAPAVNAFVTWNDNASFTNIAYDSIIDNSPAFGWDDPSAPGELHTIKYHSEKSLYAAVSTLAWNFSVHTAMSAYVPKIKFEQKIRNKTYTPEDNVHYVVLHMSDGDNTRWQFNYAQNATDSRYFGSSHRGSFAMGWGMPLEMVKLGPHVLKWYYDNMTDMDNFTAYGSGMGYSYPSDFGDLDKYTTQVARYAERADMPVVTILDSWHRDHGMNLSASSYYDIAHQYTRFDAIRGLYYVDVWGDYARYNGNILWFDGKPMVTCRFTLWDGSQYEGISRTPDQLAATLNAMPTNPYSESGYSFVIIHAWSYVMDDVAYLVSQLDPDIRVVTPEEMIEQIYLHNLNP